jgi:hypothetical protein
MKLTLSLLLAVSVVGCAAHDDAPVGEATAKDTAAPQQIGWLAPRADALEPQAGPQDGPQDGKGHPHDGSRRGGGGGAADMTYHGGPILRTAAVEAIFWGTSWKAYSGDKISGMDAFYGGFSGSDYARASDEYTGSNGQVGSTTSYAGHVIDSSAASGNGYYPVYTDLPRDGAGYCAYHSYGSCGGVPVQIGFFWDLDSDSPCSPDDTSGLHSAGLAAIANASAHELSEARTDPTLSAWYDASGNENADKCAWTYGAPLVTLPNGTQWKLQGLWSNAAYNAGTGYPNSSGQRGCLSGL